MNKQEIRNKVNEYLRLYSDDEYDFVYIWYSHREQMEILPIKKGELK